MSNRRLDAQVRQAVAQVIEEEIADPRLNLVSVSGVEVTGDQRYATVYWTAVDAEVVTGATDQGDRLPSTEEIEAGFAAARSRIQALVGKRLTTRNTPQLKFVADPVPAQATAVEELLRRVRDQEA